MTRLADVATERDGLFLRLGHWIGLGMLAAAFLLFDDKLPMPGLPTLVPVIGTTLLMFPAPSSLIQKRVLSSRPAVQLGLISYPLYLWHWPMLSMYMVIAQDLQIPAYEQRFVKGLLAVGAILLAYVTYRYIEIPIQSRLSLPASVPSFVIGRLRATGAGLAGLFLLGAFVTKQQGFPGRLNIQTNYTTGAIGGATRQATDSAIAAHQECRAPESIRRLATWCRQAGERDPGIILWGDSHAMAMFPGLVTEGSALGVMLIARSGCPPFLPESAIEPPAECAEFNRVVMRWLTSRQSSSDIIMALRGAAYLTGNSRQLALTEFVGPQLDPTERFRLGLQRTLDSLKETPSHVFLVATVPEPGFDISRCYEGRPLGIRDVLDFCAVPRNEGRTKAPGVVQIAADVVAGRKSVDLLDPSSVLCDVASCWAARDGHLFYFDDNHLSLDGSNLVGRFLMDAMGLRGGKHESFPEAEARL